MIYKHKTWRMGNRMFVRAFAFWKKKEIARSRTVEFVDLNSVFEAEADLGERLDATGIFNSKRVEKRALAQVDGDHNEAARVALAEVIKRPAARITNEVLIPIRGKRRKL
jgi:hypothetical protein